ncbi:MAG: hypothetical protein M3R36_15865 [Bacteroidota bacterium]|nr:hypothetical protein [Bacteroidota bacterium]
MDTVTISKSEYKKLLSKAEAYKKLAESIFENAINDPVNEIVSDFKKTNLYTDEFISDLKAGLEKSSLSKKNK